MRFEDYWKNYGELHASMCGGNIKQFAKEIWMSANVNTEELKEAAFALVQRLELDKGGGSEITCKAQEVTLQGGSKGQSAP